MGGDGSSPSWTAVIIKVRGKKTNDIVRLDGLNAGLVVVGRRAVAAKERARRAKYMALQCMFFRNVINP